MTKSLPDAIIDEIARVNDIRGEYVALKSMPNVIVGPQIAMMDLSIRTAQMALAECDIVQQIASLADLKEWEF